MEDPGDKVWQSRHGAGASRLCHHSQCSATTTRPRDCPAPGWRLASATLFTGARGEAPHGQGEDGSRPCCSGAARHASGAEGRAAGKLEGREAWEHSVPHLSHFVIPHGPQDAATRGPCPCHHAGVTQDPGSKPGLSAQTWGEGLGPGDGDGETGAGGTAGLVQRGSRGRAVRNGPSDTLESSGLPGSPRPVTPNPGRSSSAATRRCSLCSRRNPGQTPPSRGPRTRDREKGLRD